MVIFRRQKGPASKNVLETLSEGNVLRHRKASVGLLWTLEWNFMALKV